MAERLPDVGRCRRSGSESVRNGGARGLFWSRREPACRRQRLDRPQTRPAARTSDAEPIDEANELVDFERFAQVARTSGLAGAGDAGMVRLVSDMITAGRPGWASRNRCSNSRPPMTGISRSSRARSGGWVSAIARACWALVAAETSSPLAPSSAASTETESRWSSTTSTRRPRSRPRTISAAGPGAALDCTGASCRSRGIAATGMKTMTPAAFERRGLWPEPAPLLAQSAPPARPLWPRRR